MKNYIRYLLIYLLFAFGYQGWSSTIIYKTKLAYSTKDAGKFSNKIEHGIEVSSTATWQKVTVTVKTVASVHYNQLICSHTGSMLLYESYVTSNNNSLGHIADNGTVYKKGFAGIMGCGTSHKTDEQSYVRNNAQTAAYWIHNGDNWHRWHKPVDVYVTLTLEGDLKLSDIKRVKIPGAPTLYPENFVNNPLTSEIGCDGISSSICNNLNTVATIPISNINLGVTDLVLQVHRGIWGEIGGHQENTIGAFTDAISQGYYLLESDIMPFGITNWTNSGSASTFATPSGLACLHDIELDRPTNGTGFSFNKTRAQLNTLKLKKPRSPDVGTDDILFFDELMIYAHNNDAIVVVDMKNLQGKGLDANGNCIDNFLCEFNTQERKNLSWLKNYKKAIEIVNGLGADHFKNLAIKTYFDLPTLSQGLLELGLSQSLFDKVLWVPILAPDPKWQVSETDKKFDTKKIQKYVDDWMSHNANVLYYEPNFFNSFDNKSSRFLNGGYSYMNEVGNEATYPSIMEYIYRMGGRRSGLFSGEPIEGRGLPNRFGKWKIPVGKGDRRSDQIFVIQQKYMRHSVITTDRPDVWKQLKD
jgi:hypothetical protein